jgi:cyclopropane-fatty-acyl-phospholipid synthase
VVNGTHYQKTLEAWLVLMDSRKDVVLPMLRRTYGDGEEVKWYVRWRLFFM